MSIDQEHTPRIRNPETEPRKGDDDVSPRNWRRRIGLGVAAAVLLGGGVAIGIEATSGKSVEAKGPETTASGPAVAGGELSPSKSPETTPKWTLDNVRAYTIYDGPEVELNGYKEIAAQAKVPAEVASTSNEASEYFFKHGLPKLINTGVNMHTQQTYDKTPNVLGDGSTYKEHTKLFDELGLTEAVVDSLFVPLDQSNPQEAALVQDKAALAKFIKHLNSDLAYSYETIYTNTGGFKPEVTEADLVARPQKVDLNETADAVTTSYRFAGVTTSATFAIRMQQVDDEWKIRSLQEIPNQEN